MPTLTAGHQPLLADCLWVGARQCAVELAIELGVESASDWVDLTIKVFRAEKQTQELTRDPDTGKIFNALQLMDQLEPECKKRMGMEFSL
jgi:hypothetical protein